MAHQRVVVKLGTSVLTAGTDQLNRPQILDLVRQMAALVAEGREVILVSSGAIMAGREVLGFPTLSKNIPFRQVLAAVGQVRLMHLYTQLFDLYDITVGQALLTRRDLAHRRHYLNARNTLMALLQQRVLPVVNENDTVAVEEIKIGDNDNLSALVANLVDADLLIMLTDTAGLFTADPRLKPDARLIPEVSVIDDTIRELASSTTTGRGIGGMITKIHAAELATRSGTEVVIAAGGVENVIPRLVAGEPIGTRFAAIASRVESRKRWILAEPPRGTVTVDGGAALALLKNGKSLLPVGVTAVEGRFERGETVRIVDPAGTEIGRGITNYGAGTLAGIRGLQSDQIEEVLGYDYGAVVIHRDDLVVV